MNQAEMAFLSQVALGVFTVDEEGYVWRHKRLIAGSRMGTPPRMKMLPSKRRAERAISDGYHKIMFTVEGSRYGVFAHRVVWMLANGSFVPPGMQVNHKDGDRQNDRPVNLEVVTPRGNSLHAGQVLRSLGKKEQRGEKNTSAKLGAQQVLEIRMLWNQKTMSQTAIARYYGVSQTTIGQICRKETWQHLPEV